MFASGKPMKFSDISKGKYFDICLYPIRDANGEVFRAAVYARETTKEKTAIQKLKESEEKLRHFAEMLPETVFETDENENVIFMNINGLRMFEYFSIDLEKGIKFFNLIHPYDKNNIKNYFRLNTKKLSSFSFKCNGISKSGNAFPISVHANSIFQDGDFKGVRGIIIDETKHQKIEKALIESEQRFKEADSTKSKLFSILAHDLRGPFSGFINLTETLANGLEELEFDEIKELSGSMHISALNLYRLLDNLLSWARNQTGALQVCVSSFNIKKVISDVVNYHYLNYTHKDLEVCIDVPENLNLSADKNMIKTVFRNLFSNAIKFSNPKGKIEISAFMSENHVIIKFSDNGVGISSRRLEKLFELNVVEYSTGTRYESGTGLGMLVTKEFVEANNGSIKVESIEGEGSVITIILPA